MVILDPNFAALFEASEQANADMPPLERFILHRLFELDRKVRASYDAYEFEPIVRALGDFCSNDLSALYFDIRRDVLYCDAPQRLRRRAARTVMDLVFERLTAWLAPILAFTCEEAWQVRFPDAGPNALRVFPQTPAEWENAAEAARWAKIERVGSSSWWHDTHDGSLMCAWSIPGVVIGEVWSVPSMA